MFIEVELAADIGKSLLRLNRELEMSLELQQVKIEEQAQKIEVGKEYYLPRYKALSLYYLTLTLCFLRVAPEKGREFSGRNAARMRLEHSNAGKNKPGS